MKKIFVVFLILSMMIGYIPKDVEADSYDVERFSMVVDGENLNYEIIRKSEDDMEIMIYDENDLMISHIVLENNVFFNVVKGKKEIIAYQEIIDDKTENVNLMSTEPVWGALTSQTKRLTYTAAQRSNIESIIGLIISVSFPGASISYTVAYMVAENVLATNCNYTDIICYFNVANGCPDYRWYKKYEYKNAGVLVKSYNMSIKSFIGVRNSPANPPMCRLYGF